MSVTAPTTESAREQQMHAAVAWEDYCASLVAQAGEAAQLPALLIGGLKTPKVGRSTYQILFMLGDGIRQMWINRAEPQRSSS